MEREASYDIVSHESGPSYERRSPSPPHHIPEAVTAAASAAEILPEPTVAPAPAPEHVEPAEVPAPPAPAPVIIHRENPLNEQLYAKLKTTEAENERLKHELQETIRRLQENELDARKRERVISDADSIAASDVRTVVEDMPIHQDGVPPQVVVLIAVGVFIMTYLFF